ncbi:hypothetical protein VNI00_011333 [Paramarasmius palmivorus]|uniref:Uncharacterized protein n=1 Tax=Paramarasmius palmivorus TaxID=297713 RepID=A0AAW0CG11_9AGAR
MSSDVSNTSSTDQPQIDVISEQSQACEAAVKTGQTVNTAEKPSETPGHLVTSPLMDTSHMPQYLDKQAQLVGQLTEN